MNDDFYVVNSWMIDELGLSGVELQCFAIIWSLSRGKKQMYIAGNAHLVKMTRKTEPTVLSALRSLCEKGYIKKIPVVVNNIERRYYKAISKGLKNFSGEDEDGLKNLSGTTKEILAPNIESNIESKKEKDLSNAKSKKGGHSLTPEEQEKEDNFKKAMRERYPRFMKMDIPLTYKQSQELKKEFEDDEILQALEEIENWKPLLKTRVDAYKTIKNWINKNRERA